MATPSVVLSPTEINVLRGTFDPGKREALVSFSVPSPANFISELSAGGTSARYRYEVFDDSNNNGVLDGGDALLGSLNFAAQKSFVLPGLDSPGFIRVVDSNNSVSTGPYNFQISIQAINSSPATLFSRGVNYELPIKDFDGNPHGFSGSIPGGVTTSYKFLGEADVNRDGLPDGIFTNRVSGRWASVRVDPITGQIDYNNNGAGGVTRVVGIYIDPLVAEGEANNGFLLSGEEAPKRFGPFDSQARFQNDLRIDNLSLKTSGDFDGDSFQELYWKVNDGTAYLRSIMHADGNIQYANYQSEAQVRDYLNGTGYGDVISQVIG
jgi:hypothetical protein